MNHSIYTYQLTHTGLMSNSKWDKFFQLFNELNIPHAHTLLKLIDEDQPRKLSTVWEGTPYLYIPYNLIEWIFIPKKIEHERFNRDEKLQSHFSDVYLDQFIKKLNHLGMFEYKLTEHGFILFAYSPYNSSTLKI